MVSYLLKLDVDMLLISHCRIIDGMYRVKFQRVVTFSDPHIAQEGAGFLRGLRLSAGRGGND